MAKNHNKTLGNAGERVAADFLERRGYEILHRNWKCDAGEADIICTDGDYLIFVEVKTRSNVEKGLPEEAIGPEKRARYERIAGWYLSLEQPPDSPVRFDVVSVLVSGERALLRHHINAFGKDR